MKKVLMLLPLITLAGCQADVSDLQAFIQQVNSTTQVTIEKYPEFSRMPPFEYTGKDKRNPFQRPKRETYEVADTKNANCPQPDFRRQKQPLERYGIDALQFKGSFDAMGTKWGLVQSSDGGLYKVKPGDFLGLFYGKVTSITPDAIVISEMLPDGTGCWLRKDAKLTKASAAGEQSDV